MVVRVSQVFREGLDEQQFFECSKAAAKCADLCNQEPNMNKNQKLSASMSCSCSYGGGVDGVVAPTGRWESMSEHPEYEPN